MFGYRGDSEVEKSWLSVRTKILLKPYPVSDKRVGQKRKYTICGFTLQEFKLFNKPFKSEKSCSMCLVSSKLFSAEKCHHYVSSSKETARCLGLSLSAGNTIPCLGQRKVKLYTLFRTARPKKHTLASGTSLHNSNKGAAAPPLPPD